jgi:rhomboid protease GluP
LQCPRCAGSGQCPDCLGQGSQECPACAGQGTRQTPRGVRYACKSCSGEGKIPCPPHCSSCEGSGQITEELQQKVRDTYTVRFSNFSPASGVTRLLIVLNVLFYMASQWRPELRDLLMLRGDALARGHYWEFLSYSFLHAGLLHLLLNMGFLWSYGPVLEGVLGRARYLLLYLGSAVLSAVVSFVGHSAMYGQHWASVGASGSLFALNGAFLALYWRWRLLPWEPVRSLSMWAAVFLLGGIAAELSGLRLVDNWAHAGGLLAGFLIAAGLPRPRGH